MTATNPPAFEPVGSVELNSVTDSKIIAVSLYSSRAEVTRLYRFAVKTGLNQVNIWGLPDVLEAQSLRVEGRGAATIHDVTVASSKGQNVVATSEALTALFKKKEIASNALGRCERLLASLAKYLDSLTVGNLDVSKLATLVESYDVTCEKLEIKKSELTEQLFVIDEEIQREKSGGAVPHEHDKLQMKAAIGVFGETAGDVEIALTYAVPCATWKAFYDIRVDTTTKEEPITLIYKAAIRQNSGECWADVPLTLETSAPTFGLDIPKLAPYTIEVRPYTETPGTKAADAAPKDSSSQSNSNRAQVEEVGYGGANLTSKGSFSGTFSVPGMVTIPSDDEEHNFTIVQLGLKAEMSWISVPRLDTKAHINARITNASDFTFIRGDANVYVDGSFISRTQIPSVSPRESFNCALGVDSSIRITYHPVIKKKTEGGFSKTRVYNTRRITLFNTKSISIKRLKVVDRIPVSRDTKVEVKLVSPALTFPSSNNDASSSGNTSKGSLGFGSGKLKGKSKQQAEEMAEAPLPPPSPQRVNVAPGVVAQWDGADEPHCEVKALGLDGKLNWVCAMPPQAKVNLSLEWELAVPSSMKINVID